jgi:antitoxin (DNA-binding transcriptional repressor) of toxin-antitoxin stability system
MVRANVHDAKTHLSRYLELLESGKTEAVVVCRRNVPVAEIRPLERHRKTPRPIGLAKGKLRIPKSFFEPLPDDILDAFYGKR